MPIYRKRLKNRIGDLPSNQNPFYTMTFSLQKSCEETESCTAINWKYEGNHECILRACSLPVVPPMETLPMWKAYYLTTPTTTTTTATPITTTIPIFDGLHFISIQLAFVNFLNPFYSAFLAENLFCIPKHSLRQPLPLDKGQKKE